MQEAPEYHKIENVFQRDRTKKHHVLLEWEWSIPEFEYLVHNTWIVSEKIDGTNIRVHWDGKIVSFGGRTNDAQIPKPLIARLQELFTEDKFIKTFGEKVVTLYGEGYGNKIQKVGHLYLPDSVDFMLFDVLINNVFLEYPNIFDIAISMDIKSVPYIGRFELWEAIDLAQQGFTSSIGNCQAEGVICKPELDIKTRTGKRIITKIKTASFEK